MRNMRKKSKKHLWLSAILIVILAFFAVKLFIGNNKSNTNGEDIKNASSSLDMEITLINGNEEAGNLIYQVYDAQDNLLPEKYTSGTVRFGTTIRISFDGGLNEGYTPKVWANTNFETYSVIPDSDGNNYAKDYLKIKVKSNYNVYVAALASNQSLVTVMETSQFEMASVIGFAVATDGEVDNLDNVFIPKRRGFDYKGLNKALSDINEDISVYPTYDSNIWTIFRDYWSLFLKGLGVTLLLAVISIFFSLLLGILLCLAKMSRFKVLRVISSTYIEVIRGVPSLLLLLLIYCVVGPTKISLGSFFSTEVLSCILALFLNSSAYTAEIFRSGIQAVDVGQTEAGRALGMTQAQVLKKIVLPQGIKNALPSLGNELVMIIKETSLAYSVNNAIGELMCARTTITSVTGNALAPYIIIAIIYFIITFTLSRIILRLEKRLAA